MIGEGIDDAEAHSGSSVGGAAAKRQMRGDHIVDLRDVHQAFGDFEVLKGLVTPELYFYSWRCSPPPRSLSRESAGYFGGPGRR